MKKLLSLCLIALVLVGCAGPNNNKTNIDFDNMKTASVHAVNTENAYAYVVDSETPYVKANHKDGSSRGFFQKVTKFVKSQANNTSIDFSSLTYTTDLINVGESIQVVGVIPDPDFPEDDINIYYSDADIVEIEDGLLTCSDTQSVLTLWLSGKNPGTVEVYIELVGAEYMYSLPIQVVGESTRTATASVKSVEQEDTSRTVYCTEKGKCFHYLETCPASNNVFSTTENRAKNVLHKDPCKKCVH